MYPLHTLLTRALPLVLLAQQTVAFNTCFQKGGNYSADNFPCSDDPNETSFCCSPGYYCLSNRICQYGDGTLWRGTCTDQNWSNSSACPLTCTSGSADDAEYQIFACDAHNGGFCCGAASCCSATSSIQNLGLATIIGTIGTSGFTRLNAAATTSGKAPTNMATTSTSSSASTGTSKGTSTSTSTSISSQTSSTTSAPAQTSAASHSSNAGAIAGGVVGGLALIALLVVLGFLINRIRRQRKENPKGYAGSQGNIDPAQVGFVPYYDKAHPVELHTPDPIIHQPVELDGQHRV